MSKALSVNAAASGRQQIFDFLYKWGMLLTVVALVAVFGLASDSFLDPNNIIKCGPGIRRCNEELSKANEIYVIGSEMMSSTLGAITKGTNDGYLKLQYNYKYDDPKDPNRFFFRSDHFHYATNGIPIAFWFDGVHEDYHEASDHADKIDYQNLKTQAAGG